MNAPLSPEELAERCVCQATPVADRTEAEHAVWCPSRKPTAERLAEIKAGTGRPLMAGELEWLRGDAGRAELHISGAAAGAFPLSDNLPDWIAELGRKLGAVVAELDRTRTQLEQSENDLTGARLSLWEEEQDTRRMRLALEAAKRGRQQQRARVAELEAAARTADRDLGQVIDERDYLHDVADKLAYAVAPMEVIGEHSSGNDPWDNALDLIVPFAEVEKVRSAARSAAVLLRSVADRVDMRQQANPATLRQAAADLDRISGGAS